MLIYTGLQVTATMKLANIWLKKIGEGWSKQLSPIVVDAINLHGVTVVDDK